MPGIPSSAFTPAQNATLIVRDQQDAPPIAHEQPEPPSIPIVPTSAPGWPAPQTDETK